MEIWTELMVPDDLHLSSAEGQLIHDGGILFGSGFIGREPKSPRQIRTVIHFHPIIYRT